jgi:DNA-binding NtrC family response regulator
MSHILIVDEDVSVHTSLVPVLRTEKYTVMSAITGQEALSILFKELDINIILLSSSIKDMSALTFIHRVQELVGLPHIIIMGTQLEAQTAIDLMRAGAGDIIKRPFHYAELLVALRQSFDTHTGIQQLMRQWDRDFEEEIGLRVKQFKELVDEKRGRGEAVLPSEVKLFFPGQQDPSIDLTTEDIIEALKTKTAAQIMDEWDKPTILTVDDEVKLLRTLKFSLGAEFNVLQANTGELGMEILKDSALKIDAVLLDIGMPGLVQGNKWVAKYREVDPNVSVVMLTAFDDIDLIVDCIRSGAYDYLIKPFASDKLLTQISDVITRKLMVDSLAAWTGVQRFRVKRIV